MKDYLAECRAVENDRTVLTAYRHAEGELETELYPEIMKSLNGEPEGDDGIIGEATDVILCMLDIIAMTDPNLTFEQLTSKFFDKKFEKWKRVYGKKVVENEQ